MGRMPGKVLSPKKADTQVRPLMFFKGKMVLPRGDRKNLYEPENPQAPVTAPKGVRSRAAAPYHGVAEGRAALVIRLGNP